MKNTFVRILSAVFALALLFSFCACGDSNQTDSEYVKKNGKLRVGITDFAPIDYQDENGNWIGFDADMAKAFAESLGVKVEFVVIDWDSKELEIKNKNIDCVWNGMTLTDGVKEAFETSKPYMDNAQVVVLKKDIAEQYKTADSVKSLKFAVEKDSAGDEIITGMGVTPTRLTAQADALLEVKAGTSEACVIDLLMALAMTGEGTDYPELTYSVKLNSEQYGVGFRKGSDLAAKLNDFMKTSYDKGDTQKIAEKYNVAATLVAQ